MTRKIIWNEYQCQDVLKITFKKSNSKEEICLMISMKSQMKKLI